ncbi:GNAT family N-acetyltransferase [Bombiscardovia coagulans]|uniref:GNAT family N-acetyltransferase n=1 Tax=Bombiscardovia coagulans TaxID=686666 RepID=A0A261EUZ8_9BIFI|nr:GNAT family N-acetyltransferase [Bombiscardovia coagulans]OZG50690.1 GNAT family N-acetyltransferase [Bombiscardovia coagulans]
MRYCTYDYLPAQARLIREQVFVDEQGFHDEYDHIDDLCQHLLAFASPNDWVKLEHANMTVDQSTDGPVAIATSRFFASTPKGEPLPQDQASHATIYTIGRVAVDKAWRGLHCGAQVLAATEAAIRQRGGRTAILHAQEQAKDFYTKQGYQVIGERDYDQHCPHVWMSKDLD